MTRNEAIKLLKKAFEAYLEGTDNHLNSEELAEIALTHCESQLNMIPVTPRNTFWSISSGKCIDPDVYPWEDYFY